MILNFDSSECRRFEPKWYNECGIWETLNQRVDVSIILGIPARHFIVV